MALLFYAPFLDSPSVDTMKERPKDLPLGTLRMDLSVASSSAIPLSAEGGNLPTARLEKLWD